MKSRDGFEAMEFNRENTPPKFVFAQDIEYSGVHMLLVGQWQDLAAYYRGDDGNAWIYNQWTRTWSNGGSYDEFVKTFSNRRRGELTTH